MAELLDVGLPFLLFATGVGLTIAEAFIPGAHFIVIGVALLVAGLVGLAVPPAAAPLAMAATTLVTGAGMLYLYRRLGLYEGSGESSTSDSDSLKGSEGVVTERVTSREGEVKLQGGGFNPYYRARTTRGTIAEGEPVIVVDPGGGNVVTVEPLGTGEDDIDRELARDRVRTADADTGGGRDAAGERDVESEDA